jgi:1-acyl-sn-glycerol-3-phosphate acyltransferase
MSARDMCEHRAVTAARAPRVHWRPPKRGVWWPIWAFGWGLLRLTMPWLVGYRAFGRDHVPARGGVLVVSNHLADIDPAAVGLACCPRPAQYLAMARHFTHRPLAMLLFSLGAFPVNPGQPDTRALRHAREQLQAGRLVIIFPEGAPTWGPEMSEFREGVGHLALTPGVTVVPAALWGTHRVLRGWRPVGRGPVHVAFGPPVPVTAEGSRRERAHQLTADVRHAIQALLDPMVRERP